MSRNNRDYISCRNPAATKQQEAGWNRMVRDLEHRKAKENHRKEKISNCYLHSNSLSNKMDNSLLAVRDINHKYIVVEKEIKDYA